MRIAAQNSDPEIRQAAAATLAKAASRTSDAADGGRPDNAEAKPKAKGPDSELQAAEKEAAAGGDDLAQLGITTTDQTGQKAKTVEGIQQRMFTRLETMRDAKELAEKAHDPDVLRSELGLTEKEVKDLKPAERVKLADELKGKLAAYGIAADLLPDIVS